jgi:hypothetical protein
VRTYSPAELSNAIAAGQRTATGMVYTTHVAGQKTTGVVLFKEAHHTSKDTQAAKRELHGKFRLVEIETRVPSRAVPK